MAGENAYLFTGQELDEETGFYNYNARLYDPEIGRFLSADTMIPNPFSSQDFNRYSYCINNPIRYNDPTGHYISDAEASARASAERMGYTQRDMEDYYRDKWGVPDNYWIGETPYTRYQITEDCDGLTFLDSKT
jgi:RHS repeat-associated protein